jgi:hypothetical protein
MGIGAWVEVAMTFGRLVLTDASTSELCAGCVRASDVKVPIHLMEFYPATMSLKQCRTPRKGAETFTTLPFLQGVRQLRRWRLLSQLSNTRHTQPELTFNMKKSPFGSILDCLWELRKQSVSGPRANFRIYCLCKGRGHVVGDFR